MCPKQLRSSGDKLYPYLMKSPMSSMGPSKEIWLYLRSDLV